MVRCFLTGVDVPIQKALVLNRREANDLLNMFKDRLASLRRVIDQFAPLDDDPDGETGGPPGRTGRGFAQRKHRLVCVAAAEVIASGFPEIRLFVGWPEYRSQARFIALRSLRGHREFGDVISTLDDQALREVGILGQSVLRLIDPRRRLPSDTRTAISTGVCARNRGRSPEEIVQLIRTVAAAEGDPLAIGLASDDLCAVRALLGLRIDIKLNEGAEP